jgi:hypothetical protein
MTSTGGIQMSTATEFERFDAQLIGRCHTSRKLANNTHAIRVPAYGQETIAIKLHYTHVLTFGEDGSTVYNSGGWRTMTTRDRLNTFGPWPVYSERGRWYIRVRGREFIFEDGMRIGPRGGVTGAKLRQPKGRSNVTNKQDHIKRARARTLANALTAAAPLTDDGPALGFAALVRRALSRAGAGDAWWWGFFESRKWIDTHSLTENGGTGRTLNSHAARFIYRELLRQEGYQV